MAQAAVKTCDICVRAAAADVCVDCRQQFCEMCKGLHLRQNSTKNHIFKEVKSTCIEHVKEFIFFCTICEELICQSCCLEKHKGHKLCDIDGETDYMEKQVIKGEQPEIHLRKKEEIEGPPATRMEAEEGMKLLRNMFEQLEEFLQTKEFDEELQNELSTACPDYMRVLLNSKRDLLRSDCGIVIAGSTSAGKTSLVNLIIERGKEKLFVPSNVASTGTICRIRHSETMELKVFSKDEVLQNEVKTDDLKTFKSVIKKFTGIKHGQDEIKDAYYVDVYLPVSILKGNVIIVDTPGIGETENLDQILMDFLPHAVSFIFVVNAKDAGGVQKDRLQKILNTILQNRDKMPCFDLRDVMFVTNQWDIVENDFDEDDKETGHEKTWKNIQYKLTNAWGSIPSNNLFRVSLKQVANGEQTEWTKDYERFKKVLEETIEKNKNKRIKFYYIFFETFTSNAERGTLARLKLLERSEDEQEIIVTRNRKNIAALENDCKQAKKIHCKHKTAIISELAFKLNEYLRSPDGKEEILNPPGSKRINLVFSGFLMEEIPKRIESGIKRWCESPEVKAMMEQVDAKIGALLNDIEEKLQTIEMDFTGYDRRLNNYNFSGIGLLGIRFILLMPISFIFAFLFTLLVSPIFALKVMFKFGLTHTIQVNEIYERCLTSLNHEKLIECFEKSIGTEYSKVICRILDETLPMKLSTLQQLNEKLIADSKNIRQKRASLQRLQEKIESLRRETDLFRQKCTWLSDI